MKIDRKVYFEHVREKPFGGLLTQDQVYGQEAILTQWEKKYSGDDFRFLAYALATTKHETANTMQPIEEHGKGKGREYGRPDPETGQTYYGRGFVQLTWKENYARAGAKLSLGDELVRRPERAMELDIATAIMFRGMMEGWFRPPHKLEKYFNKETDDPYGAREIINGDKVYPSSVEGVSIGKLIAGYHRDFFSALLMATMEKPLAPVPVEPAAPPTIVIELRISAAVPVVVNVVQSKGG